MKSVVSNFDSSFHHSSGTEVMNYYFVLEHGFDELIEILQNVRVVAGGTRRDLAWIGCITTPSMRLLVQRHFQRSSSL